MKRALASLLLIAVANAFLFLGGAPALFAPTLGSFGAFLLAIALPGWGAVSLLVGAPRTRDQWLESALYGIGAGFGICAVATLLLAYLPGGIERWQLLLTFNLLSLLALVALFIPRSTLDAPPHRRTAAPPHQTAPLPRSFWWAALGVTLLAASLRLVWLGFSEFQGDEARVLLRAQELLGGFENPVFVHHKMPGEILFSTAILGLSGVATETSARLLFALAGLAAVVAVLLLGWRLFGPAAGIVAASLLAVDGFALAFGRIVQYQSVVILASALIVLLLWDRLNKEESTPLWRWMLVAALTAAGALYAHYDVLAVGLPVLWLLWNLGKARGWANLARSLVPALVLIAVSTGIFLIPWVRNPGFGMAYRYVVGERVGTSPPYNNLIDFAHRAFTYSSGYYIMALAVLTLAGAAIVLVRAFGRIWGAIATLLLFAAGVIAFTQAESWGAPASVLTLVLLLLLLPLLPKLTAAERTVWLWFAPLVVASLFLISQPDSHVYIFFLPWILLVGGVCQQVWAWAQARSRIVTISFVVAGALALLVFWFWPWQLFADAPAQRFRRWESAQPVGYWYPFDGITARANMGFPLRVGWKSVGALMSEGALTGGFETNAKPEVTDWYTRGYGGCPAPVSLFFAAPSIEQSEDDFFDLLDARTGLAASGATIHVMDVESGIAGLRLLSTDPSAQVTGDLSEDERATSFTPLTGQQPASRRGKVAALPAYTPVNARLGDAIHLLGFDGDLGTAKPGDTLPLNLMWTADDLLFDSWTVFLQLVDPATNAKAGQTDALPVCGQNETTTWRPGDLIVDPQQITVFEDAAPGIYNLYTGMYNVATGERLPVTLADGSSSGDWISLGQVVVE